MSNFYQLELQQPVMQAVINMGFEETTPVQKQTIPHALKGKDLIGQAQTGTGKTAAYGIPLVQNIKADLGQIKGLVLAPTRELTMQVVEELNRIGEHKGIRALPIYGGQDIGRQIKALKKRPHIVVATPGRLLDHIRRKTIRLNSIEIVVLDEADEMLNMGFIEDIESILNEVPDKRQTLLFSATMPKPVQKLAQKFMCDPKLFAVQPKEITVPNIEQEYLEVHEKQKFDVLCRLLDIYSPISAIVFGRTKRRVDELGEALNKQGYAAEGIHGDLPQGKRINIMNKFRKGTIEILVATDVAARGLDISGITHIFNFDIPQDPESYVHRIGRTGRAGHTGMATTFVTSREKFHLRTIENLIKRKIERKPVPTMVEAIEGQRRIALERLLENIQKGEYEEYKELAEELLLEYDAKTIISAALFSLTKEPGEGNIQLTEEPPVARGKNRNIKKRPPKGRRQKSNKNRW